MVPLYDTVGIRLGITSTDSYGDNIITLAPVTYHPASWQPRSGSQGPELPGVLSGRCYLHPGTAVNEHSVAVFDGLEYEITDVPHRRYLFGREHHVVFEWRRVGT